MSRCQMSEPPPRFRHHHRWRSTSVHCAVRTLSAAARISSAHLWPHHAHTGIWPSAPCCAKLVPMDGTELLNGLSAFSLSGIIFYTFLTDNRKVAGLGGSSKSRWRPTVPLRCSPFPVGTVRSNPFRPQLSLLSPIRQ